MACCQVNMLQHGKRFYIIRTPVSLLALLLVWHIPTCLKGTRWVAFWLPLGFPAVGLELCAAASRQTF